MAIVHSPANKPIAQQRIVRADAVRRVPGAATSYESPLFSWSGTVNALAASPAWRMRSAQTFDEVTIDWLDGFPDTVEFDILVNGSVVETINTIAADADNIAITPLVLVRDDRVHLETTDFGSGVGEKLAVGLRRA